LETSSAKSIDPSSPAVFFDFEVRFKNLLAAPQRQFRPRWKVAHRQVTENSDAAQSRDDRVHGRNA
jgi:hypothetical protein